MTTETQTFWTILPNGIVNEKARLSVFVTPKLIGEPGDILTLIDFPDMLDWPQLAGGVEFKLFWRKDEASLAVPVDSGHKYKPVNRGEFGLDARIWNHLFKSKNILVDPELRSTEAEAAAERNSLMGVTYRAAIIDRMVTETQVYHTMRAVLEVGEEPRKPDFANKQEFDRLVYLASGEAEVQLKKQGFATKVDGEEFQYNQADSLNSFFGEVPLDGAIEDLTGNNRSLNDQYLAFALYHRHGIQNRNYKIRHPIEEPRKYPDFNFHNTDQYQIDTNKEKAILEFSENIPVSLPSTAAVLSGFEVNIFFAPDESIRTILDPEKLSAQEIEREVERRVPRDGKNPSGGINYRPLTVSTQENDTIDGAAESLAISAFRGVKFTRIAEGKWASQPLEQQDFHSIISGLGSYPILLRQLGLVFDIEIDASALPGENEVFQLLVEPIFLGEANVEERPNFSAHVGWSACETGNFSTETANGVTFQSFCMVSEEKDDPTTFGGFQVLNPRKLQGSVVVGYSLQDTDAAIHKVIDKAIADGAPPDPTSLDVRLNTQSSERRIFAPGSPLAATNDPDAVEVEGEFRQPASRSTGISLFLDQDGSRSIRQYGATVVSSARLKTAVGPRTVWPEDISIAPVSFRDDVTAGWKIDVFVKGDDVPAEVQKWYSLSDRQLKLNFLDDTELGQYLAPSDASWIEKAGASEFDESGTHQLRVSDYNFRVDHWSNLSSKHPSKAAPGLGDGGETWMRSVSLNVSSEAVAYSQVKIRNGRTYIFRIALKDIAGNGVHFDYANAGMATSDTPLAEAVVSEPITYRRLDPMSPPVFYALQPPGPGAKVPDSKSEGDAQANEPVGPDQSDVLIIRSGSSVPSTLGSGEWLVLPPDTDFQEFEAAGMLDGFSDPDVAFEVLERYGGKLPDAYDPGFLSTIRWPSGQFGTPYLPDGYAAGATFCYLPGSERELAFGAFASRAKTVLGRSRQVSFDLKPKIPNGRSPFSQPFRLRLRSGNRQNRVSGRDLIVDLPPGEQQLIKVSCYPDAERLEHFELAHKTLEFEGPFLVQRQGVELIEFLKSNTSRATATATLVGGLVYQISPSKLVRLIHAVPKPTKKPVFSTNLQVTNRVTGGNAVVMEDTKLALHRVSTGKIDIFVEWQDYLDIPGVQEFPLKRQERRHCFECDVPLPDCTIAPDETHSTFDVGGRHGFPTNKHLQVNYTARATTRYKEYFGEDITSDLNNLIEDSDPSCDIQILNTAPPPKPEVVYILPNFLWKQEADEDQSTTTTTRMSGFTVYMKRGWFRSGREERLAVVMQSDVEGAANVNRDLAPVPVTVWGSDPTIYDENPIARQPVLEDCLSAVEWVKACPAPKDFDSQKPPTPSPEITKCSAYGTRCLVSPRDGVPLPPPVLAAEIENASEEEATDELVDKSREADSYGPDLAPDDELRVDIAAYDVNCDFKKDLLYAHVELKSPGAYMPFVRFALARYQKNSAKYCALSSITHVDYVQLAPHRAVTIIRSADSPEAPSRVSVVGPGRGEDSIGHRTNILRVYRLSDRNAREQYPLEVKGQWLSETESVVALFQWQFELSGAAGDRYFIEEYEIGQDGQERLIFSGGLTL